MSFSLPLAFQDQNFKVNNMRAIESTSWLKIYTVSMITLMSVLANKMCASMQQFLGRAVALQ